MTNKQRTWGQYATPIDLADLLLGLCLRRPDDRFLDPSCGEGALLARAAHWQQWLATVPEEARPDALHGIELDPQTARAAHETVPGAHIIGANFFALSADDLGLFDTIVGNPPYTRGEWIDRLDPSAESQLALFPEDGDDLAPDAILRRPVVPHSVWSELGGRSGLHAYFFLHSHRFLREGGRLGFIVPNGWLDVDYGGELKQFLLDHFRIVALIESAVERWFDEASVNTCVVVLERSGDPAERAANRVRFARLHQPLDELLPYAADDGQRVAALEQLVGRLLPAADRRTPGMAVRVVEQGQLSAEARWGPLLRAPDIFLRRAPGATAPLSHWATVQRGYTTGANPFFYLTPALVDRWSIEPEFRRPLLKSLRHVTRLRLGRAPDDQELLVVPPDAELRRTSVARYIAWGEEQGYHLRRTCAARRPWYALPEQATGALLLPKGVWMRHLSPRVDDPVLVDQQLYRVGLAPDVVPGAAAALLNSAWFALQCELRGRVNFGEGVLWLAAYELEAMQLPDPRVLGRREIDRLRYAFQWLADRPVGTTIDELDKPDRRNLDETVFELLGLSPAEGDDVRQALKDSLNGRRSRARS
jgi:methylase of polypeptide subunit release factors